MSKMAEKTEKTGKPAKPAEPIELRVARTFCSREDGRYLTSQAQITATHLTATDGKALIHIVSPGVPVVPVKGKSDVAVFPPCDKIIADATSAPVVGEIPVRLVLELADKMAPEKRVCETCDGTGEVECECPDCQDEHTKSCPDCRTLFDKGEPKSTRSCRDLAPAYLYTTEPWLKRANLPREGRTRYFPADAVCMLDAGKLAYIFAALRELGLENVKLRSGKDGDAISFEALPRVLIILMPLCAEREPKKAEAKVT